MKPDPDVTIVGAGIVGVCCALALLENGRTVRIVDQAKPGEGASHGNAGVISPWSFVPQSMPGLWKQVPRWLLQPDGPVSVRWRVMPQLIPWAMKFFRAGQLEHVSSTADAMSGLVRTSISGYRHFLAGTGRDDLLRDSWYVSVLRRGQTASMQDLAWRLRRERGAPVEVVDGNTLRDIEPAVSSAFDGAVLIKGQARATSPGMLCKVLSEKAIGLGAQFIQTSVSSVGRGSDGAIEVRTGHGPMRSPGVVVAAGAWSLKLLQPTGLQLPLIAERGYHLEFSAPGITLNNSVMDMAAHIVASSVEAGVRTAGTAEFSRLDARPNFRRAQLLEQQTRNLFPGINTVQATEWMGVRPSMPDSLPVIGPIPGYPGLFAAFGHSHYGMSMAPGTARLIADLLIGRTPEVDPLPYRVNRWG